MALMFDARVPVVFGSSQDAREGDAVLASGLDGAPGQDLAGVPGHDLVGVPGHDANCACCVARSPAAQALGRLFMQRARGEVAFFRRVLVDGHATEAAVRAALQSDPVAAARFRLG